MKKIRSSAAALCLLAVLAFTATAQAPSLADAYAKIRAEETNNSKIMWILHQMTDVHGPRVTGSPTLKAASEWAMETLKSFGLQNVHLEPWTFQPPSAAKPVVGWENIELSADAMKPFRAQLMVKPLAWTPNTKGVVTSEVVMIAPPGLRSAAGFGGFGGRGARAETLKLDAPMPAAATPAASEQPTREELDGYFKTVAAKVRGRIVMVGKTVDVSINLNPAPLRRSEEDWKAQFDPGNPNAGRFGGGGGRGGAQTPAGKMTTQEVARAVDQFLLDNGALVRINDSGRAYGIIIAQQNSTYDSTRAVPTLVMRNEDYGRIARILEDGAPVTLRINIQNREYPEGVTAHNVIAEIPGTDKKDEVVMLGGHFDSWHDATGATDNAAGCSMMMEAVRILSALKLQPRRTIRLALWTGEEQGLLGSLAYVQQHFGSAENPKPEFAKLSAYFNIDSGTSRPRGASVFGPPAAAEMIREGFAGFDSWGFRGARATNSRATGGTDSTSFNNAGLPGVGLSQDPFDYNTFTHHTNLDTIERIHEEDVRAGAAMIASAVYAAAMADQMVPRFAASEMPAPVPVDAPGSRAIPAPAKAAPAKAPAKAAKAKSGS